MKEIRFPLGWYDDALPDGRYCVLIPQDIFAGSPKPGYILTEFGRVELPGQNLLFIRRGPGFHIAGCGHQDGRVYEWDVVKQQWVDQGPNYGNNGVIYDNDGVLHLNKAEDQHAHGMRYVTPDNRIVYTDETYASPRKIFEWTVLPNGWWIGQGPEAGLHVLTSDKRYVLEGGDVRFVRTALKDGIIALAYVRQDTKEAIIRWYTEAEILALPENHDYDPPPPAKPPQVTISMVAQQGDQVTCVLMKAPESGPVDQWRWLLNGNIVGSNTTSFTYTLTGPSTLGVRAAGPGGMSFSNFLAVEPMYIEGFKGLVVGGAPLEEYAEWKARGGEAVRLVARGDTPENTKRNISNIQTAGLRPIVWAFPEQLDDLPGYIDWEPFNEPDIGTDKVKLTADEVAQQLNALYPKAKAKGIRLWVPASSSSVASLQYIKRILEQVPDDVGVSIHDYRELSDPALIKGVIGNRPFMVSEFGINRIVGWFKEFPKFWKHRRSDKEVADYLNTRLNVWRSAGASAACIYQIGGDEFGVRKPDGSWVI